MLTELDLLLRALASPTRLRILQLLRRHAQGTVNRLRGPHALAAALRIRPATVTFHLKVLLRMRLVSYLKKERYKFYRLAAPRRGSLRTRLMDRILDALPRDLGPVPPHTSQKDPDVPTRPRAHSNADQGPLGPVWRALTAFSFFRRLLMLRTLHTRGTVSLSGLRRAADLSLPWTLYHIRKLRRRGVLAEIEGEGPEPVYRLNPRAPTPLQAFLTSTLAGELVA